MTYLCPKRRVWQEDGAAAAMEAAAASHLPTLKARTLKRRVWQEDGAAAAMEAAKRSLEMHGAGMYGVQGLSSAMHLPVRLQAWVEVQLRSKSLVCHIRVLLILTLLTGGLSCVSLLLRMLPVIMHMLALS